MNVIKLLMFLVFIIMVSCNSSTPRNSEKSQKIENPADAVNYAKLYNDVFNQLIIHHTYDKYLGCKGWELQKDYIIKENIDSVTYTKTKQQISNELLAGTAPKSIIYVDVKYKGVGFRRMGGDYFSSPDSLGEIFLKEFPVRDSTKLSSTLKNVKEFSLDSLNSSLVDIRPSKEEDSMDFLPCDIIGSISLSQVYLSSNNKLGLLFWGFGCGPQCGRGELIKIKREKKNWKIIDTDLFYNM